MSSPSVDVLSMASIGPAVAGGSPNMPLDAQRGRRGEGVRRSSDGGSGAGDAALRGSVYSSTSYAASRGYRPASGGDYSFSHPVAPPRTRGAAASTPSARGIKKSSSEVMSMAGAGSSRRVLKSSSGVLNPQHSEVPLSRSTTGGFVPMASGVNFNSRVVTSDDSPTPAAPTSNKAASETHNTVKGRRYTRSGSGRLVELLSPTGRTLTRQPEGFEKQQQQGGRRRAEDTSQPGNLPRARHHQQEAHTHRSLQKLERYPQPKECDITKKQEQRQHEDEKDVASHQHPLIQQQQREARGRGHRDHLRHHRHSKETESQNGQAVRNQQVPSEERRDSLKKEQVRVQKGPPLRKSTTIDIAEVKQQSPEDSRDQYYQQLVRAGSLGSGEPAAILEQRRSRSPLRTPGRAYPASAITESKHVPSVIPSPSSAPEASREGVASIGGEKKHGLNKIQDVRGPAIYDTAYSQPPKSADKGLHSSNRPADATRPAPPGSEARTGVIRAAAKAYTENFQSYSFSGYLTKNKKDTVGAKESPQVKEYNEVEVEVKQPPANISFQQGPEERLSHQSVSHTHNNAPSPLAKSQSGKIIVPLTSFVLASKSSEPIVKLDQVDRVIVKQPVCGTPATKTFSAAETKEAPVIGNKGGSHKADQGREKGQGGGQEQPGAAPHHHPGGAHHHHHHHHHHPRDPPTKTPREKHINSSSPLPDTSSRGPSTPAEKKPLKSHSTLFSTLKSLGGDKMKGNSEGALLVACRVGEEDQVLRLLKELTATGVLDASALNQADRSGRTALSYACANAFQRVVEILTGLPGADINKADTDGNTPLHFASQAGHTEVVSHLVNKCNRSVDLDARNALGFTPLMKAALQGRTKIAKILLFAGASPHLRDFGRGLCAVEWARYTGRHVCSELIDSVQKSCSSHIRDRWTSDPDLKSHSSTSINTLGQGDNKESWIKHKIKKAFHKSDSKKEFSVVTNLSSMAMCATTPVLPTAVASQDKPHQVVVPHVQVTEVKVPDCYEDPEDALSRLPPSPPPVLPPEEASASSPTSSAKSPKKQPARPASTTNTSSTSPPSSPPSSPPASATKPSTPIPTTPAAAAAAASPSKEPQKDSSMAEVKSNGTGKISASPSKAPISNAKKKK